MGALRSFSCKNRRAKYFNKENHILPVFNELSISCNYPTKNFPLRNKQVRGKSVILKKKQKAKYKVQRLNGRSFVKIPCLYSNSFMEN